jgi:hypothetical protein
LNTFLRQLQERLASVKQSFLGKLQGGKVTFASKSLPGGSLFIFRPVFMADSFTYLFIILTVVSLSYWGMRVTQIASPPEIASSETLKGVTLYRYQNSAAANDLFGSKPLVTDNILLRGVVVTSQKADGKLDGYAIFEIDGKSTNAISVGENLGKGLNLFSIGDESATLLYQGQQLQFKLYQKKAAPQSSKKSRPTKNGITTK